MITDIVKNAQAKPVQVLPVSRNVRLCIDWLGRNDETHATEAAIGKMDNDQVQQFAKLLLDTITATRDNEADKGKKAKEELTALFGKEILEHAAVTQSRDGFFFSLTGEGKQFRAWYAPFGSVTRSHFDSCGTGCVFAATSDSPEALREWITLFVARKAEWKSDYLGSVWMGHGPW
jgi:hypothetical protein